MASPYAHLREVLADFQEHADQLLSTIADDQLHSLVNAGSRNAALGVIRIDQIDQAAQQQ